LICPICQQWNPDNRSRCMFCQEATGAAPGPAPRAFQPDRGLSPTAELEGPEAEPASQPFPMSRAGDRPPSRSSSAELYRPVPGNPRDIARTMRVVSIVGVTFVVLVSVFFDCMMS